MGYTAESDLDSPIRSKEREMLVAGFSYAEVAYALGVRHKSVSERNRLVYRVDLRAAFAARVERGGTPCRLAVSDAFGYWFSGFFDGEGCLTIFSRARKDRYFERRVGIQIMLRDDDADVIRRIKDNLGVGLVYASDGNGSTNPKATYRCEQVKDLTEVIVPLFEKYPLHSKKAREFAIWKQAVRSQYIVTLGGYSQRASCTDKENAAFDEARKAIRNIRTYC